VFRRKRPRYELPERVQADGCHVYFTMIDIAPPEESGDRQKRLPIRITEKEMLGCLQQG
jgi:hypothetical protein